ncbi:hypothetical protein GLI01_00490 [Gluconacetobacter liquefaciens]|uniref:Uncharacterized protein n=1 Tax=Gluconacetobacter liquefaciens TaxID=89584 RepID=A0A370GBJ7_GLULI|nr:hypothetical protein C7453_102160 [Gluconacetobacter liquefaciens]GEB36014.1 hypothetical protein GLI01_00490 [Gluconacetobacter liquefaciens]
MIVKTINWSISPNGFSVEMLWRSRHGCCVTLVCDQLSVLADIDTLRRGADFHRSADGPAGNGVRPEALLIPIGTNDPAPVSRLRLRRQGEIRTRIQTGQNSTPIDIIHL